MVVAWKSLAELHLSLGDTQIARDYAQHVIQLSPALPAGHLLLGMALSCAHDFAHAQEQFILAQRLDPSDPWPHVRMADVLAALKQMPAANKEYETALNLQPGNPEIFGQFLGFLLNTNQGDMALTRARQNVAANANSASAHYLLGNIMSRRQQYAEAKTEAERAIELDANFFPAYLMLGSALQQLHQTDAAIARYEKAIVLRPNFPPLETLVGNLYLDKGDLATARKHYEQALAINPNFAIAASNLAWVYTKQGGNLDVALGLAQKAKQLMPELDSITDTLAWVQYRKGSYISAKPLLQECVRKAPQYAPYHYHLGMVLAANGEKAKAKSELEAALRMKLSAEDATDARQALAKLN